MHILPLKSLYVLRPNWELHTFNIQLKWLIQKSTNPRYNNFITLNFEIVFICSLRVFLEARIMALHPI